MQAQALRGFVDESSANRSGARQEYLVGADVVPSEACDDIRRTLMPLLLPGQKKLHWTDERPKRRRLIVDALADLGALHFVISHGSERSNKTERFRRKCLEQLYYELSNEGVLDLTLESRSQHQDLADRAHIVALQGQGMDGRIRIAHRRGGDEPLLWIPDALLGALNCARNGNPQYWEQLAGTVRLEPFTQDSLPSSF